MTVPEPSMIRGPLIAEIASSRSSLRRFRDELSSASGMGPGVCHDLGTTVAGLGVNHGVVAGGSSSLVWAGR